MTSDAEIFLLNKDIKTAGTKMNELHLEQNF